MPTTATEIMNRLNEISFNSSLMREMRAISFVTDLVDQGKLASNQYKRVNVHWIEAVYNRQRRHSAVDMMSPVDYEDRYWSRRAAA